MTNTQEHATWGELLHSAVHTPGKLLAAYTAFHNYSFGNALLALTQCHQPQLGAGSTQYLSRLVGTQPPSAQRRKGHHPLHADAVQKACS